MRLPQGVEIEAFCHRIHVMKVLRLATHGKTVLSLWRRLPHIHHAAHVWHPAWPHVLWRHAHVLLARWVMDMSS